MEIRAEDWEGSWKVSRARSQEVPHIGKTWALDRGLKRATAEVSTEVGVGLVFHPGRFSDCRVQVERQQKDSTGREFKWRSSRDMPRAMLCPADVIESNSHHSMHFCLHCWLLPPHPE